MIIVKLIGGLGNQLFQYAAAKCLAEKKHTIVKIDIHEFETTYKLRKFALQNFAIDQKIATQEEIKSIKYAGQYPKTKIGLRFFKFKQRLKPFYLRQHVCERGFAFDSSIFNAQEPLYLEGYFQSEKYFLDIENIIRKIFTIISPPENHNLKLLNEIKKTMHPVSIHIRRGDYATDIKTNQTHGVCPIEYYQKSVELIEKKIGATKYFIFSDDPKWAKENLKLSNSSIFIEHNGIDKHYEDLRLMSACQHHIIANSSFSWWAAWLNPNLEKIVIAPKRWFRNLTLNTKDLIPQNWIQL